MAPLRRVRGNNKQAGGNKPALLAHVILGRDAQSVHRIFWQRVSNLVNKFTLLFKRSMFTQDSRDKPENDGCKGRLFNICCMFINRMYHSGASANELTLKAKDDVYGRCRGRWLSVFHASALNVILRRYSLPEVPWRRIHNVIAYAMSIFFRHPSPEAYASTSPSGGEVGRSMIEMLGVLAIVAVLSVGGIAGYSKAMMKYKINKVIGEYSYVFQGLLEYMPRMQGFADGDGYADLLISLNLVPNSWKKVKSVFIADSLDNYIQVRVFSDGLDFETYLGHGAYKDTGQNYLFCRTLIDTVLKPLSNSIAYAYVWRNGTQTQNSLWYGDKYCSGKNCLKDVSLADIDKQCKSCTDVANKHSCSVVYKFIRY